MAESVTQSYFPKQTVSDAEKLSSEYGLKVAKAIEQEWFADEQMVKTIQGIDLTLRIITSLDYTRGANNQYKNIKMNYLSTVIYLI